MWSDTIEVVLFEYIMIAPVDIEDTILYDNSVLDDLCVQPAADLRQFNRAQVLYDALYNHLYTSEAPLIQVLKTQPMPLPSSFKFVRAI